MYTATIESAPIPLEELDYILACTECEDLEWEDIPASDQIYAWKDEDTLKLLIKQIGEAHILHNGLHAESLVNRIASVLDRPELAFSDSLAWSLVNAWATEYFGVPIAIDLDDEESMTEEEIRQAQQEGELWVVGEGKHPVTGEPEIMVRNDALFPQDFSYMVMATTEWGDDEDDYGDTETRSFRHDQLEEELLARTLPNEGVLYQRLTRPSRGVQVWYFFFKDEFSAKLSAEQLDHVERVVSTDVAPIEE
jgi:hypothetical protein